MQQRRGSPVGYDTSAVGFPLNLAQNGFTGGLRDFRRHVTELYEMRRNNQSNRPTRGQDIYKDYGEQDFGGHDVWTRANDSQNSSNPIFPNYNNIVPPIPPLNDTEGRRGYRETPIDFSASVFDSVNNNFLGGNKKIIQNYPLDYNYFYNRRAIIQIMAI